MQDIDSLPEAALADQTAAGLLRWPVQHLRWPRWPGPGVVLPDTDRIRARAGWIDAAGGVLWLLGLASIVIFDRWEAVPFHLIWIVFAVVYCFRVRTTGATMGVLAAMVVTTFAAISVDVLRGTQPADELTSVPLMAAMFWVMMWDGRRRQAASAESVRVSEENERLLTMQQRFLQDASHQLRTPITIALGHSELLAQHLADNQDKRDIHVVVGELNRLKLLSERLLLIAASADPAFLQPEPVDLAFFAVDVLSRWQPTADRHWQAGRLDECTVSADRERLGLAVDALLENAVQHTRASDTITLSIVRTDSGNAGGPGRAAVVVEDSGAGIRPAELASIFDRFATGSHAAGRRGTGLGLALVRAVAEGHGGGVAAYSVLGQGSRFELTLPVLPASTTSSMPSSNPWRSIR